MSLPVLNKPSLSVPRLNAPSVYVPRLQVPTPGNNYYIQQEERRHVKDLGDIILGHPITGTKQLRNTLLDNDAIQYMYLPILNRIAGTIFMIKERTIEPMSKGNVAETVINSLETVGGTLDTVANPVKSLMPWAGGGSTTDLYKSLGWLEDCYREAYQWNTGNWLTDVVGEMVSDPINWATIGSEFMSASSSSKLDELVETTLKNKTDDLLIGGSSNVAKDKAYVHNIAEALAAGTADDNNKLVKDLMDRAMSNRRQLQDMLKQPGLKRAERKLIEAKLAHFDEIIKNDLEGHLTELVYELRMSAGYRNYVAIRGVNQAAKAFDNALTSIAFGLAPAFGVGKVMLKYIGSSTYKVLHEAWISRFKKFDIKKLFPNQAKTLFKDTLSDLSKRSYLLHQNAFKKLETIFSKYGFDAQRLQMMYLEIYDSLQGSKRTTEEATKIFRDKLFKYIPELEAAYKFKPKMRGEIDKAVKAKAGVKELVGDDIDKFIDDYMNARAASAAPDVTKEDVDKVLYALEELADNVEEAGNKLNEIIEYNVKRDFQLFLEQQSLYDTPANRIAFAVHAYMQVDGVQYGLHNIEEFLVALQQSNPENYARITSILDYLGITVESAPELNKLLLHTLDYNEMINCLEGMDDLLSNLHRELKRQVDDLLDADSTKLSKGLDALEKIIEAYKKLIAKSDTLTVEEVNEFINKVAVYLKKLTNVNFPNTLGSIADYTNAIKKLRVGLKTLRNLNIKPGRANCTDAILDLLTNNKQGGLATKFASKELQSIFRTFNYKPPKLKSKELLELRKRMLGHAEKIEEIDEDYTIARNYQIEFIDDLSKTVREYNEVLESKEGASIIDELEELDRYAGLSDEDAPINQKTPRGVINDLFEFEMSDDYDLEDFDNLYEALKLKVKHWRAADGYERLSSKAKQFVDDLNALFVTKKELVYRTSLAELMSTNNHLYFMMLRKINNFNIVFNAITMRVGADGTWSDADKLWFEKLVDPTDSTIRDNLMHIAKVARKNGLENLATDIEHILASLEQMQAYAYIEKTLRDKYSKILSKEQCNYIINLVYDGITNSNIRGGEGFTIKDLDNFMARYKAQYSHKQYEFIEADALEYARKQGIVSDLNTTPSLQGQLYVDDYTDPDYFESFDADEINIAQELQTDAMDPVDYLMQFENELMQDVRNAFQTYLVTMNNIARHTNVEVTAKPMINYDHMMNRIKELAEDYLELMEVIEDSNLQEELSAFVRNIGGSAVKEMPELKTTTDELIDKAAKDYAVDVRKVAPNMNKDGVFDAMREGFRQIGTINADLAGKSKYVNVITAGKRKMQKIGLVTEYLTYKELDDFIKNTGIAENIYDYTLANDIGVAFKKYKIPDTFLDLSKFKNPTDNTGVFRGFIENYRRALAFVKTSYDYAVTDYAHLEDVRQALIEVYSKSDAAYAPIDAFAYFSNLSYEDLQAWDMVTKIKPINQKVQADYTKILYKKNSMTKSVTKATKSKPFSYHERVDYNEDPAALYRSLERNISNTGFTEPTAFKEEINYAGYKQFANIREYAAVDFKHWVKDPETLLQNNYNFTQHIKNNVDAWENVRVLDDLVFNSKSVASDKFTAEQMQVLNSYGIKGSTSKNNPLVLKYYTRERANILTASFKSWDAASIRSYLDHDTQGLGFVIYVSETLDNPFAAMSKKDMAAAGIEMHTPFKDKPYIVVFKKASGQLDTRAKIHKFFKPKYIFKKEQAIITDLLNKNRHYFEYDGGHMDPEFFTGEVIDLDTFDAIMESDEMTAVLGDLLERKSYSKAYAKGIKNNFILNTFIIGGPNASNELYSCMAQRFQDLNKSIPYHSLELPKMVYAGTHTVVARANNAVKYLELFFNEDYALGSKHFVAAFKDATDEEIADFFKKGNYVAMVIKEDKQGRPIIFKTIIENRADLNKAIAQDAVAVPYEIYRNAVLTINKNQINSKLLNIYRRTIVGTFKSIYLTTAGFLMRNEADSAVYKNMSSMHGVSSLYDAIKYQKRAWDMWKRYSDIQKAIIESTKVDGDSLGTLNKQATRKYLAKLTEQDRALYELVDVFTMSSASGGYSKALQDMLAGYNFSSPTDLTVWEKAYNEKILNHSLSPARWVMDLNSQIEQTSRLALFLKVVDESGDYAKAIKEVITTHFDYELREPGLDLIEDIFWFSTFPLNNMAYYLNEGLTRNPDVFKLYMDMLEQSWNNEDITWDDVRKNNYYAYNAMRGNLRFKIANKDIVLKINNSVMDYLNILASPFEEAKERLNPFASVLLGIEPIQELNPLASSINRYHRLGVGPGKSLVPSVYMELYPNNKYNYIKQQYNRYEKTWRIRTKKPRKPANIDYMRYKFLTKPFFLRKYTGNQVWKTYPPSFYKFQYSSYRANSKLNRIQRKLKLPVYFK
jgi:DNA-binding ferritin-like protein (Dps family)